MEINIKGFKVFIDDEDFDIIKDYSWYIEKRKHTNYVRAYVKGTGRKNSKKVYMHKIENRNGLDNRKNNLRYITRNGNNRNRKISNKTGFRGIRKRGNKYQALIKIKGKQKYLGSFDTPEEASKEYENAVCSLFPM